MSAKGQAGEGGVALDKASLHLSPNFRACDLLVRGLQRRKAAWPFVSPVDARALNIPDYFRVVTTPCDLQSVSQLLREGRYRTVADLVQDLQRIWDNARKYNPPGHLVATLADEMAALTADRVAAMRGKLVLALAADEDQYCVVCRGDVSMEKNRIVFCDACDRGFHERCLGVAFLPEGEFHCPPCWAATHPDQPLPRYYAVSRVAPQGEEAEKQAPGAASDGDDDGFFDALGYYDPEDYSHIPPAPRVEEAGRLSGQALARDVRVMPVIGSDPWRAAWRRADPPAALQESEGHHVWERRALTVLERCGGAVPRVAAHLRDMPQTPSPERWAAQRQSLFDTLQRLTGVEVPRAVDAGHLGRWLEHALEPHAAALRRTCFAHLAPGGESKSNDSTAAWSTAGLDALGAALSVPQLLALWCYARECAARDADAGTVARTLLSIALHKDQAAAGAGGQPAPAAYAQDAAASCVASALRVAAFLDTPAPTPPMPRRKEAPKDLAAAAVRYATADAVRATSLACHAAAAAPVVQRLHVRFDGAGAAVCTAAGRSTGASDGPRLPSVLRAIAHLARLSLRITDARRACEGVSDTTSPTHTTAGASGGAPSFKDRLNDACARTITAPSSAAETALDGRLCALERKLGCAPPAPPTAAPAPASDSSEPMRPAIEAEADKRLLRWLGASLLPSVFLSEGRLAQRLALVREAATTAAAADTPAAAAAAATDVLALGRCLAGHVYCCDLLACSDWGDCATLTWPHLKAQEAADAEGWVDFTGRHTLAHCTLAMLRDLVRAADPESDAKPGPAPQVDVLILARASALCEGVPDGGQPQRWFVDAIAALAPSAPCAEQSPRPAGGAGEEGKEGGSESESAPVSRKRGPSNVLPSLAPEGETRPGSGPVAAGEEEEPNRKRSRPMTVGGEEV